METFIADFLSDDVIQEIRQFKETKLKEIREEGLFLNEIIREDILPLLDKYCTVIYFPIEDKENNGFHKVYLIDGRKRHFVYINTKQSKEKQIFTAAHELGHVWKLDEQISSKFKDMDDETVERVMNRFAAELLMPYNRFIDYVKKDLIKRGALDGSGTLRQIVQMITSVMNEFFVPYKSVVYRLYELKRISADDAKLLLGDREDIISKEEIDNYSRKVAKEEGYDRLYKSDGRKWIEGLREKLDLAKENQLLPISWLEEFYRKFDYAIDDIEAKGLHEEIKVVKGEEGDG